jgi:DNA primase
VPWQNNFMKNLLKKYSEEEINLTGLYYKNDKTGKFIDRFNSRVIFPVNNITGDTIAFGGRIIRESKLAKYINSPETEFYKKGNMIFNLDKAKDLRSETDEVLIVEGYMDVVSVYSSGIKNVIANSGTALTERQISLIWKFFSNPIICLDGDESGQKAALRIAEKLFPLINEKNKIHFSIMPDGTDPDDFIKQNGKDGLLNLLKEKEIIQSFIWNYHLDKIDQNNPYEISKFEKEIKSLSYSIQDETLKKYVLEDFLRKN